MLGAGGCHETHRHPFHQVAWAQSGTLRVSAVGRSWTLPPSLAVWLPAEHEHAVAISRTDTVTSVFFQPWRIPTTLPTGWWTSPTVVAVDPLFRELVRFLAGDRLPESVRAGAESVATAVLRPALITGLDLPMPTDPRALDVAHRLLDDPSNPRCLEEWAIAVGAASRTISRLFTRETGMSFAQWRAQARLQAALVHLNAGRSVHAAARAVGYDSSPGFVAAFRKLTGHTPGAVAQSSEASR